MSVEVVSDDDGTPVFVISGNQNVGYYVHRIGKPIARYDTSDRAWDAVAVEGELERNWS